jgi:Glycosyl transferase family 2
MKLWGTAMVRDEADVIEAFVRHNLTVLDGLSIVDHGSTDGTGEILAALLAEGLPLDVATDATLEHRQSQITTSLARRALAATGADHVFLLDADEFLKIPSRSRLEADLATLPSDVHAVQESHLYVPDFARHCDPMSRLRSARRVADMPEPVYKAVVSRSFADSPTLIAEGNHLVVRRIGAEAYPRVRHAKLHADLCTIAHVPIRSAAQYTAKIAVGWLACAMRSDIAQGVANHWRDAYSNLLTGAPLTPEGLVDIAANYGLPAHQQRRSGAIRMIDAPFIADDVSNRYDSMGRTDPLARVLRFAERLAGQYAEAHRSQPAPSATLATP